MTSPSLVVPLDGSAFAERAIPIARALANALHGSLLFVSSSVQGPDDPSAYLHGVAAALPEVAIEAVVSDRPAAEAIEMLTSGAEERTLCMTSHGRGRLRWAVLGSVAETVVASSTRPVVLVGPHCTQD